MKGEVPKDEYLVPIGAADVKRSGKDVSLITFGRPLLEVIKAADELAKDGVEAEIIDLRSVRPLDEKTIIESVSKTSRCVVVDESWPMMSVGSQVGWLVSHRCFDVLDAQVELVSGEDVPMPYNHALELAAQPSMDKIVAAVKKVLYL
ncbi:MAG: alpha-ketoacid dehydrogenase subunit beta, partial [Planctomycetes bacterium]|nr:alpha-ketoacid dehydrogenase subunit beta [Planctomycetota bacterium]